MSDVKNILSMEHITMQFGGVLAINFDCIMGHVLTFTAEKQRQHNQNQETDKQDFGNSCRTTGDAAESQDCRDYGDNKKYHRVA